MAAVLLPIRPNDTTGWIPRNDVTLLTTRYWITVDKLARTVTSTDAAERSTATKP